MSAYGLHGGFLHCEYKLCCVYYWWCVTAYLQHIVLLLFFLLVKIGIHDWVYDECMMTV